MSFKEKWKKEKEELVDTPQSLLSLVTDDRLNELPKNEYIDVIKALREEWLAEQQRHSEVYSKYLSLKLNFDRHKRDFKKYMLLRSEQGTKYGPDDRVVNVTAYKLKASHLQKFAFVTLLALNEAIIHRRTIQNKRKFHFGNAIRYIIGEIEDWTFSDSQDPKDSLPCFVHIVTETGLTGKNPAIAELLNKQFEEYISKDRKSNIKIPKS